MSKQPVSFTVNGEAVDVLVEPRELLVHTIRERLQLTGTHIGCETTHCGACTVDLNGKSIKSCTTLTVQANGGEIVTVEGLAASDGTLHPIQSAFIEEHGLQCGFCTPGMLVRAYRLLQDEQDFSDERIRTEMAGNLCRCTGYQNIIKAVRSAASKMQENAPDKAQGD